MQLTNLERSYYKVRCHLITKLCEDNYRNISSFLDYMFHYNVMPIERRIEHKPIHDLMNFEFFDKIRFFDHTYYDKNNVPIWIHSGYYTEDFRIQAQYSICIKCGNYHKSLLSWPQNMTQQAVCKCKHSVLNE